jgi:hypothetical protein
LMAGQRSARERAFPRVFSFMGADKIAYLVTLCYPEACNHTPPYFQHLLLLYLS